MKNWFTSLNAAIILSAIAFPTFWGARSWIGGTNIQSKILRVPGTRRTH